jgi:purine nucleosidase
MSESKRILLDMDVGIDDAIAIIYLAARKDVEIVALGTVHGNSTTENTTKNALRVLEACGLDEVPVARGCDTPLEEPLRTAPYVHGEDGLGDVGLSPPRGHASGEHAIDQLLRLGREQPGELDLVATGPLTNLGAAVRRDPGVLASYNSVTIMGGSGPFPPVGVLREVDANIDHDKIAAKLVFSAPRQLMTMVGGNVCTPVVLDEQAIKTIAAADTEQARLTTSILVQYLDFYRFHWGRRVCPQYDALAVAIAVDPTYATASLDGPVNILDSGDLGRAWLMRREDGGALAIPLHQAPPTRCVTGVDADRFLAELIAAHVHPLPRPAGA